jgi:hypothetical protein
MTQLQQAGRRSTVLTSAIVAAVVSVAVTISGLLIVPELTRAPTVTDAGREARLDRAVAAGLAWQDQRQLESVHYRDHQRLIEQAGIEWQLRYELTNPNR